MSYDKKQIFGKDVYIFEDHATAILPWLEITSKMDKKPYLISLDYHTDTLPAFTLAAYKIHGDADRLCRQHREFLHEKVKLEGHASVSWAFPLLKNDEHIDFAIRAGIISHSFSIQYFNDIGTLSNEENRYFEEMKKHGQYRAVRSEYMKKLLEGPVFTYSMPKDKMFIVPYLSTISDNKLRADQAIENTYLRRKLCKIWRMNITSKLGRLTTKSPPYILDIDLDYFRTKKAISPKDPTVFYKLIKHAAAITIAMEPDCVEMLRLDNDLNSGFLLSSLLKHIETAMSM